MSPLSVQARFVPARDHDNEWGAFRVWLSFTGATFVVDSRDDVEGVALDTQAGEVFAVCGDLIAFDPEGRPSVFRRVEAG